MPVSFHLRAAAASLIVAGLFAPPRTHAQPAPSVPLKFVSASLKLSDVRPGESLVPRTRGGPCPPPFALSRNRREIGCVPLNTLIGYAFNVPRYRVAGPGWMDVENPSRFDVEAVLPPGASLEQIPEMLQSLLAERLHLAAHPGAREQSVDALVVAGGGLKLKETPPQSPGDGPIAFANIAGAAGDAAADGVLGALDIGHIGGLMTRTSDALNPSGPGFTHTWTNPRIGTVSQTTSGMSGVAELRIQAPAITCQGLADILVAVAMLPDVADMTQTTARYQLDLKLSLSGAAAAPVIARPRLGPPSAISVQLAQEEFHAARRNAFNKALLKLGLQLDARTAPVDVLVIDHIDQTPN